MPHVSKPRQKVRSESILVVFLTMEKGIFLHESDKNTSLPLRLSSVLLLICYN